MPDAAEVPDVVTLHLWGVPRARVPQALIHVAGDRFPLARTPGLRFAKMVGTGRGRSFTKGDADPLHWGLFASWASREAAAAFELGPVATRWSGFATERLTVSMRPLRSKGLWAGRRPFGDPQAGDHDGALAVITRGRIATRRLPVFWRAVPPVVLELQRSPGLRLAIGFGELPVMLQGTFSLWQSTEAMTTFAYGRPEHREAVRRTAEERWYVEELFARLAVTSISGTYNGTTP